MQITTVEREIAQEVAGCVLETWLARFAAGIRRPEVETGRGLIA